jgi:hypothetical protein
LFAVLFSTIYLIINPELFNPYKIETRLLPKERCNSNQYHNLDTDEFNENISFDTRRGNGSSFIEVSNKEYHFRKDYSMELVKSFIADYDNDSYKEVYFCTNHRDSLFLTSFSYKTKKLSYKYLGDIVKSNISFKTVGFLCEHDYNNDSFNELYFYVNAKFNSTFRCIVRYDIKNNEIKKSPYIESLIVNALPVKDNGKQKFVYTTWGLRKHANYKSTDSLSYIKAEFAVLDDNLDYVFKPIKYEGENKVVGCMKIKSEGKNYICLLIDSISHKSKDLKEKTLIQIFSLSGLLMNYRFIEHDIFVIKNAYFTLGDGLNDDLYITLRDGGLLKMNNKLKFKKRIYFKDIDIPMLGFKGDIDGDGSVEMFFHDNSKKNNIIVKENFSNPVVFSRPKPYEVLEGVSVLGKVRESLHNSIGHTYSRSIEENLYLESKYLGLYLRYYKDNTFWHTYFYFALFFLFIFSTVWFIRYLVAKNMNDKYEVRNRIAELRFKNVSNQMSPHFTMNAMNSIASLIYKEDKDKAYDYLSKFARLMKISLLDAGKSTRSLGEELVFVRAYLELQKLRFKDKLDFHIVEGGTSISKIKLMPFIVQTFVENAIKHGISDLDKTGLIKVLVTPKRDGVLIEVEDNGVGRRASMLNRRQPSTGKGISLVKEYMNVLNKKDNRHMSINIVDLYENDEPSGTRIKIFIDFFEGEE